MHLTATRKAKDTNTMLPVTKLTRKTWNFIKRNTYTRYVYLSHTQRSVEPTPGVPHALVHLDVHFMNNDMGRYAFILCKYFEEAGYQVVVRTTRHYYESISTYKKPLLALNVRFVRDTPNPANSVLLTQANGSTKLIKLAYGFDVLNRKDFDCVSPYPMHPNFYRTYPDKSEMAALRGANRGIRVLFSGNMDKNFYQKKEVEANFNVLSRNNVLERIKGRFEKTDRFEVVKDPALLQQHFDHKGPGKIIINEVKTDASVWLPTLSRSAFFICPPGVRMPWCHNLVESMAVGTIPILQYAHLMSPKLVHMKNCLFFDKPEDLESVIETALNMSAEQIAEMRAQAIVYFEEHLSLESIKRRITTFCQSDKASVVVALPFINRKH